MNKEIEKKLEVLLKEETEEFMRETHRLNLAESLKDFIYDNYTKKDYMFQCIIDWDVKKDTWLISFNESVQLWEDYYEYCNQWINYQIGLYTNCINEADYSYEFKIEDSRDI